MHLTRKVAIGAASLFLVAGLSACSSDDGDSSASGINCAAANDAILAYSAALTQFVGALTEDNADQAREGSAAFVAAAEEIPRALPGVPAAAESFVTVSQDAGRLIDEALTDGVSGEEILDELNVLFNSDDFSTGGDAVDTFFRNECPEFATPG